MRTNLRQACAAVVLLLALVFAPACSVSLRKATAIANEELSAATVRLRNHIQAEADAGRLPQAELRTWKSQLGRVADVGILLTKAIVAGDNDDARVQIMAAIKLLDEFLEQDVIRLNADQRMVAMIAIQSVRTSLLIISVRM